MAESCIGKMSVVLPAKHIDKFLSYFDRESKRHFHRVHIKNMRGLGKSKAGMAAMGIEFSCPSSVIDCLMNLHGDEREIELDDAIKACEVSRLTLVSREKMELIDELITFDKAKGPSLNYDCRKSYPDPFLEALGEKDVYMETSVEKTVKKKAKETFHKECKDMEID